MLEMARYMMQYVTQSMSQLLSKLAGLTQVMPADSFVNNSIVYSRAICRVLILIFSALFFAPILLILSIFFPPLFSPFRRFFFKFLLKMAGIKLEIQGQLKKGKKVVYVANHISYMDVLALGAKIPGSFVAKNEVGKWPLINFVSVATRTLLIARITKFPFSELCSFKRKIYRGENVIFFPEGTTSEGSSILKFKSSLFRIAEEANENNIINIQPISLAYTKINGERTNYNTRKKLAWYGDAEFVPHLWEMFKTPRMTISLFFHPALTYRKPASRKLVTQEVRRSIEAEFRRLIN